MKKGISLFAILSLLIVQLDCQSSKNKDLQELKKENEGKIAQILPQKSSQRFYSTNTQTQLLDISLRDMEKPIFRPTYLKYDKYGSIYIIDLYDNSIHKIIPNTEKKNYVHKIIGNASNQSNGGLTRILDFKIYDNHLYLVNEGNSSIILYSLEGTFEKRIQINNTFPLKIALMKDGMIVQSKYSPGHLFKMCDTEGKVLYEYGDYVDKSNLDNSIYHDNALSEAFDDGYFYYLPYYLGFIVLYQKGQLIDARETIDGLAKKAKVVEKRVTGGYSVKTITKNFETASMYAVLDDFLLIKAIDLENKTRFWDFYDLYSSDYIVSLKDGPPAGFVDVCGDNISCLYDNKLQIYSIRNVLKEIRTYHKTKIQ